MVKAKKVNKNPARGKLFGVVINPKLKEPIEWKGMSTVEIESSLKKLKFPNRFVLTDILNELEIENVHKNKTVTDDFVGQLEIGTESSIPHYQLAISTSSICTRKKVLSALEEKIEGHMNVEIQFNFEEMKNYCSKKSIFVSEEYSGKIYKHQWEMDFLERKPQLKKVLENPFEWQKFLKEEVLLKNPDDRTVDWIIDPIGNTGKSSFARAYVSNIPTDGILMKIDNLDRMELTLIQKIEKYRQKYYKDPKVLFFDFPRASDSTKIILATALMEDAKSGHLETTFGGNHKEIEISDVHIVVLSNTAPDLSVLSIDRWRLWRLGGKEYNNIIWPVKINSLVKKVNTRNWNITWTVSLTCLDPMEIKTSNQFNSIHLNYDWYGLKSNYDSREHFGFKKQYVKDMVTNINYSPNFVKIQVMERVTSEMTEIPIKIKNFMIGYPISYGDYLSHDNAFTSEALVKVISTKVEDICTEERIFLFKKGFAVGSMVVGVSSLLTDTSYAADSSGVPSSGSVSPPSDGACLNPPGPPAGGPVPDSGPSPNPKFKPVQVPSANKGLIAGA